MKIKNLHFIFLIVALLTSYAIQAQQVYNSNRAVIFEEDFNGWASITAEGWFTHTIEFNYIDPNEDAISFFKQDDADWMMLITPEIDLTEATLLTFMHKRGSSVEGQKLEVGTMSDPTDPSTFVLLNIVDIDSAEWNSEGSETILTGVTGVTHIAFNVSASSPPPYTYIWLDDVLITDDPVEGDWPSYVTNMNVEPAPMGENYATVSWTNPDTQADGDPLTDLDSIVIKRNGEWGYTLMNPVIGGDESVDVTVSEAGLYVFTITAYNSEGGSVPISNEPKVWVGLDTPGPVENLQLTVIDDTVANLSWAAPTVGSHGGYFDGVVGSYKIVRVDGFMNTVQGDTLEFEEVVDVPGTYNYDIIGINNSGEGIGTASNAGAFYFNGYLLAEDFWVSVPALDWEKQGFGTWYHWPTDYTGSDNPWEMIMHPNSYFPFTGIARMVSPVLNTQEFDALSLKFHQYHQWLMQNYSFKIQTTSDGGNTWTDVWSIDVTEPIPAQSKLVVINNADVGSENFQFAFVFDGNSQNLDFLALDDLWLYRAEEVDLTATKLILPEIIEPENIITPLATLENWGYLETDFTATMTFFNENDDPIYESVFDSTISGGAVINLTFEDWTAVEGSYTAVYTVSAEGDTILNNNTLTKQFDVLYLNSERTLVVCEEGTGTWCGYCPSAAKGLDDLIQNNWPVAVIAYHKSDDFETTEGIERIDYYGINGYPTVIFDGVETVVGGNPEASMYSAYVPVVQSRLNILAPASIEFKWMSITDNTMHVHLLIESGSPILSDSIVLQGVLTESHIPKNWGGMTELNYVERNMFNGSGGKPIDLSDQVEELTVNIDLDPNWVRQNCELVVFVQNLGNKEIYNGNKIDLITVSVDENEKWVGIYPNPAQDYLTISNCEHSIINIYSLQGTKLLTENITSQQMQINVSKLIPGFYVIEIVVDNNRYTKKLMIR